MKNAFIYFAIIGTISAVFVGANISCQSSRVSCAYAFELYADCDNNGQTERSDMEKSLATEPNALGVIVPFFPDKSDKQSGLTEFQLVFSPLKNEELNTELEFQFGSDEVSLWVNDETDKKRLFIPPAINNSSPVQAEESQTQSAPEDDSENVSEEKSDKKSNWWSSSSITIPSSIANFFSADDDIDQEDDFDSLKAIPEPVVSPLSYKCTWRELGAKAGDTELKFYLRAETPGRALTYRQTAQLKRPTRTLVVKRINPGSIESASAQYIVAGKDSFYSVLQKTPELSVALAAACVYEPQIDDSKNEKTGKAPWMYCPQQYCLSKIDEKGLLALGFSEHSLRYFREQDNSGYAVSLYKDYINNDRYILAFRGTSFKLSMIEDVVQDVNVASSQYSPYILKALFCGYHTGKIFEKKKQNVVITGHSLGGALACTAGIVSGLPVIAINGLGINKEGLNNTLAEFEFNSPPNNEIEFKKLCKTRFEKMQTENISYIRTKWDLLSVLCEKVDSPLYLKNGNSIDIFPAVKGKPIVIDGIPCDTLETEKDKEIEKVEKGQILYDTALLLDEVVKFCGDKQEANEKFSFKDACISCFSKLSVLKKIPKMQSQVKIAGKCHSINQVIYGILKIKKAENVY